MSTEPDEVAFEDLVMFLRDSHAVDFSGYKRSTLIRRVRRRLDLLHLTTFGEYIDRLEVDPDEFGGLLDTVLINVTGFFRDQQAWEHLRTVEIPGILAACDPDEPVRVWSAGCASGEEAYTIAVLLADSMGVDDFRRRVKVYATDVDDGALAHARAGVYGLKALADVPENLRTEYFDIDGDRGAFRPDLRRSVIFGRHDLLQDAPISRLDLLLCRNTLMYFTPETQGRILRRFHYALKDDGFLFLGRAEMLLTHTDLFTPVELKHRVFSKVSQPNLRDRLLVLAQAASAGDGINAPARHIRLREAALDAGPAGQIVVDSGGLVVSANEQARAVLGISVRDTGRHLQDLEVSYRPLELRSRMERAAQERAPVRVSGVERQRDGGAEYFDVVVTPVIDGDEQTLGFAISFTDVTPYHRMQAELMRARQELETAYEELQSMKEELETTNEELQSTVEELETTNEELQSANEELETVNEELESTNAELQAINADLRSRTDDVHRVNGFMESVLAGLHIAVIVIDAGLRVSAWNGRATEMWGLRSDEAVGESLISLDIGLPVDDLAGSIRRCLAGEAVFAERELQTLNRRGRTVTCKVSCTPLRGARGTMDGAVLLVEEVAPGA